MASISREPNGRRSIQFVAGDGKRRTIRLGKISQRGAEAVKLRVEMLNAAAISGHAVDPDTAKWLAKIEDDLRDKLTRVGLVHRREASKLAEFIDGYIADRADVKPATATVYGHTRRCLVEFFGADASLRSITPGDADRWRLWLIEDQKLAPNTVRRRCGIAKQYFRAAVRQELLTHNPFADLVSAVQANTSRYHFVSREDAEKIIEACPDAEWRLIFALSRYGGLRCPSEHLALRWSDIDWAAGRMTVPSPKTEHHAGGESRVVPIFPELLPYLEDADQLAGDGAEFVIQRYRDPAVNLRTQFQRILKRAKVAQWPKLFQNLRSTRETELAEEFPLHVVCAWIGNSQPVAAKHYLQVTDAHFERAVSLGGPPSQRDEKSGESGSEKSDGEALQNPVQSSSEMVGSGGKPEPAESENAEKLALCGAVERHQVGDEGLETVDLTYWVSNNFGQLPAACAAESGAVGALSALADPLLVEIAERWESLSPDTKMAMLRLARQGE